MEYFMNLPLDWKFSLMWGIASASVMLIVIYSIYKFSHWLWIKINQKTMRNKTTNSVDIGR